MLRNLPVLPLPDSSLPRPRATPECSDQLLRTMFRTLGLIRKIMTPFFEGYGISVAQWVVLLILLEREQAGSAPLRLIDLSQYLMIRQPTLTAVVNKLTRQGLVERIATAGDRRERQLCLTPAGRGLVTEIQGEHNHKVQGLLQAWDLQEKHLVFDLMDKLWRHLAQMDSARPARSDSTPETD